MRLVVPAHLRGNPEAEAKIREVRDAIRLNPLLAYNNPELSSKVHHKQLAFNAVKVGPLGIKALIAGNRSGKTFGVKTDDVIQLVPAEDVPPHLIHVKKFTPPIDVWMGAPKYAKHEDTTLPILRKLIPKDQLKRGSFDNSYSSHSRKLELNCGSNVFFKTYDQDPDAWASAEVHRISWDEEPNTKEGRTLRSEARARLVSTGGDEILGMTPLLGISTWAYDDVWEKRNDANNEFDIVVHGMAMDDNPWNTPGAIAAYLAGLTDEEREARRYGKFVHFGGIFFSEFSRRHTVEPPSIEKIRNQEIVVSIDPGLVHTGVTWSAWDTDNAGMVFSEFFPPTTVVPEIATEIKRRNAEWKLPVEPSYIIDPSYRNLESSIYADQVQSSYAREGIYAAEGNNDRRAGILEVKRRLQARDGRGFPAPTLLVSRECPELIRQMERYRRNPDAADEWQAVPQDDRTRFDLVDSMRYAVMARAWDIPLAPEPDHPKSSYQQDFQPPLSEEQEAFQGDAPPMGDMS